MTLVYNYHPVTGELMGNREGRTNPKEPEAVLVPKFATLIEPPVGIPGKVRVFSDGEWSQVDDHRGETWWDGEEPVLITDLIDPASEGLSDTDPVSELDRLKTAKIQALEAHGNGIMVGGFPHDFGPPHGVQHLQTRDTTDRTNWLTSQAAYKAQIDAGNGHLPGATFRTAENTTITISFDDAYTLLLDMAAWGAGIHGVVWAKKDQILAAPNETVLDNIDIETGW